MNDNNNQDMSLWHQILKFFGLIKIPTETKYIGLCKWDSGVESPTYEVYNKNTHELVEVYTIKPCTNGRRIYFNVDVWINNNKKCVQI